MSAEIQDLKTQVQNLNAQVQQMTKKIQDLEQQKVSSVKAKIKQCKCHEPIWIDTESITKFGGEDFQAYDIRVAYICHCGGHYECLHVCQMYHCNTKVECGIEFCASCFDKQKKKKEYEQQGKTCCRCKAIANPFIEPEGSFCSDHCRIGAAWYG